VTGVLLQVRLGSTRLPGKALLELAGRTVIEHAMRSLRRLPVSAHLLVTDAQSAPALHEPAARCGFRVFVGPQENVLERFVLAAREFELDEIVRATGDNPLVSWELARLAVAVRRRADADYVGFDGPPLGTGVEVVRTAALETALRESDDPYDAEHVTPFLYRHPEWFTVVRVPAPGAYHAPRARVTLDTADDLRELSAIFEDVYDGAPVPVLRLVRRLTSPSRLGESHVHAPCS
jgi:spore coat polysaccharide biosynthesis protein SpsF